MLLSNTTESCYSARRSPPTSKLNPGSSQLLIASDRPGAARGKAWPFFVDGSRRWRTASSEYRHCNGATHGKKHEPHRQRHRSCEPAPEPGDRRPQASRYDVHEAQCPEDQRDQETGNRRSDDVCSYRVRVRHCYGRYLSTTSGLVWPHRSASDVVGRSSSSLHALDSTHRALPKRSADFKNRDPMWRLRGLRRRPARLPAGGRALPARATTLPLVDRMAEGNDG